MRVCWRTPGDVSRTGSLRHPVCLLHSGTLALDYLSGLESMAGADMHRTPKPVPPWMQRANGLAGMLAFSLFANKIRLDRVDADDLVLGRNGSA
jgi:hypothetical protein